MERKDMPPVPRKRVIILGSTGSIGTNALSVCSAFPERFSVTALSAHTDETALLALARRFGVKTLALSGKKPSESAVRYSGQDGLLAMIAETDAEIVVNGISGAVGLLPSREALRSGKDLALANKETMVLAGSLITELARETGKLLLPVDSEHSAIFFLLAGKPITQVDRLILTASGGAFRDLPLERLPKVTPAQTLLHPTGAWQEDNVDSATMANKGLEVMEAQQLFVSGLTDRYRHPSAEPGSFSHPVADGSSTRTSGSQICAPILAALSWRT
jgi:1-deoxy-D-xylulose-5-phosphate reductoisomerase